MPSVIMLNTGLVYQVAATRDQVNTALASGPKADTQVNGVNVSFRTASVVAVADTIEGLRPLYLTPVMEDPPDQP